MYRCLAICFPLLSLLPACAFDAPASTNASAETTAANDEALSIASLDKYYVAIGRCDAGGAGLAGLLVNGGTTSSCLAAPTAASDADPATVAALATLGVPGDTQLVRVDGFASNATAVRQVFTLAGNPPWPLDQPMDGQRFFQISATACGTSAIFSALPLNDGGFIDLKVQRAFGANDIVVSYAGDLPAGFDLERVRHEVQYEQAAFRGTVERPTFDILHPFAQRPLLVTVFELLPRVRTSNRCP